MLSYTPVVWAALFIAQSLENSQGPAGGLPTLIVSLTAAFQNPLEVRWTNKSPLSILNCVGVYIMTLTLWGVEHDRRREGAGHDSAVWAPSRQIDVTFAQKKNKVLTHNVRLGPDTHKHRRSPNMLVIGGSGAAKTRSYVKPNILEANTSYVITDSEQEMLTATGGWLKQNGYEIRVLSLVNLGQSDGYNPFRYLRDEKDALKLVDNLIQATIPKGSHKSDPFWTKTGTALPQVTILMLFREAPEYEQNSSMAMRVPEYTEVKEESEEYISPLDLPFQAVEQDRPDSTAVWRYKIFKMAAGKTSRSILVSTAAWLAPFNLPQTKAIIDHNDVDFYALGEKECVLYAVIPDNGTSFNFPISLLYAQAFQTLYYSAGQIHHGALSRHVHFVLDEFVAIPLPGLIRELAAMRFRNISASTIIQNMAQIKGLHKDSWETIPDNLGTILYLGGNEASIHKYISEVLGKTTIDTRTRGQTKGHSGSYSTNSQMSGRELLTPDGACGLNSRYTILFVRGARSVTNLEYELIQHPVIRHTVDGGGPPYTHKGKQMSAFIGTPLFQALSAEELNENEENIT